MCRFPVKWCVLFCGVVAGSSAWAEFAIDRSAVSEKYWAIWNDDEQRKIDADIEANRKADAAFEVDAPAGTEVKVEQIGSSFRFGAHIFNFNQLGKTEYNDAYKASYGEGGIFNQATVAFYWINFEPTPGHLRAHGMYEDSERYWNALTFDEAMHDRYWRRPAPDVRIRDALVRHGRAEGRAGRLRRSRRSGEGPRQRQAPGRFRVDGTVMT